MTARPNRSGIPDSSHCQEAAIAMAIQGCFVQSPYPALRKITSEVTAGVANLVGEVPSYYLKQLAQEIAMQHEGVEQVNNHIRVGLKYT